MRQIRPFPSCEIYERVAVPGCPISSSLQRALSLLLAIAIVLSPHAGIAAEPTLQTGVDTHGWTFDVTPYLWLPEQQGTARVRSLSTAIDVDFDQLFDLLGDGELLAGMVHAEAHYGRLSLFVDGTGGTVQPSQQTERGRTDLTLNFALVEFGPAYRVFEYPGAQLESRPILIDVLAGGRFMYFDQEIRVSGSGGRIDRSADGSIDWVDPFVGGRTLVPLIGALDLFFRGDIGGFDAGSKLAWNLVGGFLYELPWQASATRIAIVAAYRALDFDYEGGSGGSLSLDMRGPALGMRFAF